MIVIICVDDNNGIFFNNRRQSQDEVVRKKILEICEKNKLWMNTYSSKQFSDSIKELNNIIIDDNFINKVATDDYCFVEGCLLKEYEKDISKLVLFRWNRDYPYDMSFDLTLDMWNCVKTEDFIGKSHKNITMEVYEKLS